MVELGSRSVIVASFALCLLGAIIISGCGHVWTREFIIEKKHQPLIVDGWTIEPDIAAFRNIGGTGPEPLKQNFYIDISISHPKDPKRPRPDTTAYFTIDTLILTFLPHGGKYVFPMARSLSLSYSYEHKYIEYNFCFAGCGEYKRDNPPPFIIPKEVDSISLSFDLRLTDGFLYAVPRYGVMSDSIAPASSQMRLQKIPVNIRMVRHESEHNIPAFMIGE